MTIFNQRALLPVTVKYGEYHILPTPPAFSTFEDQVSIFPAQFDLSEYMSFDSSHGEITVQIATRVGFAGIVTFYNEDVAVCVESTEEEALMRANEIQILMGLEGYEKLHALRKGNFWKVVQNSGLTEFFSCDEFQSPRAIEDCDLLKDVKQISLTHGYGCRINLDWVVFQSRAERFEYIHQLLVSLLPEWMKQDIDKSH